MKELPIERVKNGFKLEQLVRSSGFAVYKKTNVDKNQIEDGDDSVSYEVFKIKRTKAYTLTAKPNKNQEGALKVYSYPDAEAFPLDGDFGLLAWEYNKEESAIKRFNELNLLKK